MINCLIVEDEPLAAGILEDYVRQVPFLRLVGVCGDAVYAAEALREQAVDLIFLDIHLPGLKGLDFLRTLSAPPNVILTTAYHEYAVESYDFGVVDYLLKPIDFERFMRAVQKVRPTSTRPKTQERAFHFFNSNKKMVRVWLDEVLFVESLREYIRINLADGKSIVTKAQIGEMEQIFDGHGFVRMHRSFLVSLRRIDAYTGTTVQIADRELPIGRQYRDSVLETLSKL